MLISSYTLEYVAAQRVRVTWSGTIGLVAWIAINGVMKHGPLFFDGVDREFEFNVPELFKIEIHEAETTESVVAICERLTRRPLIWWSARAGAVSYTIYRRPTAAGEEVAIASVRHDAGRFHYELRPVPDLRGDGGVWNTFRVESVNARGIESEGDANPLFVAGLPAEPVSCEVDGTGGVFDLTLGV